jgi:hypothetical protein
MEEIGFGPTVVKPDAGRITIPARFVKQIPWISEDKAAYVWLLMLQPGRFRLLPDAEVAADEETGPIRSLIVNGPEMSDGLATVFEPPERAARVGRLVPTNLSLSSSSGWRLSIPKQVAPKEETFVLLFSLGRLEIWLLQVYNEALAYPLSAALGNP